MATKGTSGFEKFRLLLWKNWLLQKRKKVRTLVELILPLLFCTLLVVIRFQVESEVFDEATVYEPFGIQELPLGLKPSRSFDAGGMSLSSLVKRRRKRQATWPKSPIRKRFSVGSSQLRNTRLEQKQGACWDQRRGKIDEKRIRANRRYKRAARFLSRRRRQLFGIEGEDEFWPLAYAPNTTAATSVMRKVEELLGFGVDISGLGFANENDMVKHLTQISEEQDRLYDEFFANQTEEEVEKFLEVVTYFRNKEFDKIDFADLGKVFSLMRAFQKAMPDDILGGIVFTNVQDNGFPDHIKYKIRLKGSPRNRGHDNPFAPPASWHTTMTYPLFQIPGPRAKSDNEGGHPGYFEEGFLWLQHAVDLALTDFVSGRRVDWLNVELRRMPYPPYIGDPYLLVLQVWLPLLLILSYIYPAINIVKNIVHEKERRLKESMKMMGMEGWLHWLAWFVKSFLFLLTTSIGVTILICVQWSSTGLAVLENSDPSFVFFFLFVYLIAAIIFCFFLSTLFSKANSAALATGLLWFFSYVPYTFLRPRYSDITLGVKLVTCLLPNMALSFGCQLISMYEGTGEGIQWYNGNRSVSPDDEFTLGLVIVMMVLDCVVFAELTWYIEAVFPGEYGIPQPWYFPFTMTYWRGPGAGSGLDDEDLPPLYRQDPNFFEEDPKNLRPGIIITGLSKMFSRGKKLAVNNMNLRLYKNHVTALLGHNGAGKTTTMSMLTGLYPPTSGTALVEGFDIRREMEEVRQSLGLCPQHDVLFDSLTVAEHIIFFSRLKGLPKDEVEEEVQKTVQMLKLDDKTHWESSTLSGGMKRKLSVGIALCAGSRVVILDEPTSGMDPQARRATWDILQREKKDRTLLLTTHFMEEADLLGDRIAIMAGGVLQCCGSSLFLKKKYGAGYRLTIVKDPECDVLAITELLQQDIPNAELDQNVGAELTYLLPNTDVSKFEKVFSQIEENKEKLKISSYGVSLTTMEEVFLRVGEASNPVEKRQSIGRKNERKQIFEKFNGLFQSEKTGIGAKGGFANGAFLLGDDVIHVAGSKSEPKETKGTKGDKIEELDMPRETRSIPGSRASKRMFEDNERGDVNTGCGLFLQQFWAMLVKKAIYTRRNWVLVLVQIIVPVAFLILALEVLRTLPNAAEEPPHNTPALSTYRGTKTPVQTLGTSQRAKGVATAVRGYLGGDNEFLEVTETEDMNNFLIKKADKDLPFFNLNYMVAMVVESSQKKAEETVNVTAYFNNQPFHVLPLALGLVDNALFRYVTGKPNAAITVTNHPLPRTDTDKLSTDERQNVGFQVGFNLAFGCSFLTAAFVLFLIRERITKAKHLQYVSGLPFTTYWATTALWDLFIMLIPISGVLISLKLYAYEGFREPDDLGRVLLVLLLFAWSTLPLMYLFSYLFSVPASGFAFMTMFNIFSGMATILTVQILRIPELELEHVADNLYWVFLTLPFFSLAYSFADMYANVRFGKICSKKFFDVLCRFSSTPCCKETKNCGQFGCLDWTEDVLAWHGLGIGRPIVFLVLSGLVFYVFIVLIELEVLQRLKSWVMAFKTSAVGPRYADDPEIRSSTAFLEDSDVTSEKVRIRNTPKDKLFETDKLVLTDLSKIYNGKFRAVEPLNLGVPLGECFGLLGVNGAGKTTTFKILTGDLPATSGDAFVSGFSVSKDLRKVQQQIGYCPQFDALIDQMTGRECLRMFARVRGVHEDRIDDLIERLADQLLVTPHLDKITKNYSGGNRRKVSTGVALIGDPPLVLLDEPTTGMDPVARRLLWDVLVSVRDSGRSIILTSHSMEECEALCTRLAIMVNGRFRCLGPPQHLKSKFGDGFSITIRIRLKDESTVDNEIDLRDLPAEMFSVKQFVEETFPDCELRDIHRGFLHYHVPAKGLTWSSVFGEMERSRQRLGIEDYSVSQTTLEQVFLTFAKGQRAEK
ncbi:phospholipid-transporting ATPase ABCA3-like [Oratosquilla oratoria]|uniref:phospholipid-transporting ATPase ABCA3-like n=1 Tax=Oratosquilla oratoria TaxID=337810 RepID=UPI003F760AE4